MYFSQVRRTNIKIFLNKNCTSKVGEKSTEARQLTLDIQHSALLVGQAIAKLAESQKMMMESLQQTQRMMLQQQEQVHRLIMEQPQDLHVRETAPELKIRPYDENEDVTEFLTAFKRTMTLQNMDE